MGGVAQFHDEMLERVSDEAAWGPGKVLATAAQEAGVDLSDEASVESFVAAYNSQLSG